MLKRLVTHKRSLQNGDDKTMAKRSHGSWFLKAGPKAGRVVGIQPRRRLRWLLGFAQRPGLALLKDQRLDDAIAEIAFFAAACRATPYYESNRR